MDQYDVEIEEDLMDLIDPDLDQSCQILSLAGRMVYMAIYNGAVEDEADYERALLKSVRLATGELTYDWQG